MKDVFPLLVSGGHQHLPLVPQVLSEDDQLPPCPGQILQVDVFMFDHQDHNLSLTPTVTKSIHTPPPALPLPRLLPVHPVHPPGTAINTIIQQDSTLINLFPQHLLHIALKILSLFSHSKYVE